MAKRDVIQQFRAKPGKRFRIRDFDPAWNGGKEAKRDAERLLTRNLERLTEAQDLLWSTGRYALLIVLQAMDAAGKDGLITHVMSGMNPQGCQAFPFKQPSSEDLQHDFLWRYEKSLPARGRIGIFNRSYYEEVLVVRVHPEWLDRQNLPPRGHGKKLWRQRYQDINAFEKHLVSNGTVILKFFLNISEREQRKRLLERLEDPTKHWKFSEADLAERAYWDKYMEAYQDAIGATSTEEAPWHIIPADHKWVSRWLVSEVLAKTIESLDLKFPRATKEKLAALNKAIKLLKKD
ncbi:MAG TPA: polyphosphate kinase 2 family protein [Bryobacteraceae bacterium]|nr:polyphosphate kinase 2 family protein [Bryobacteraceae bacterium]